MASVGDVLGLIRRLDSILATDKKYGNAIDRIEARLIELDLRLTRLEARGEIVVEQAKAAAASASAVMMHTVADMARRIGSLEARTPPARLAIPD